MGIKSRVLKWAEKVGKKEAKTRLMKAGLKYSVVAKLISGNYGPEPKKEIETILEKVMAS